MITPFDISDLGGRILQSNAFLDEARKTSAERKASRERLVALALITPAVLGLLVLNLPPRRT